MMPLLKKSPSSKLSLKIGKSICVGCPKKYKTNFVEIDEDNEAINYYLKKKDKYPEIVED